MELFRDSRAVRNAFTLMAGKVENSMCQGGRPLLTAFITILKGGQYTASNILNNIYFETDDDVVFGNIGLSSYKDQTTSSEKVTVTYPLDIEAKLLENRIVWLIDDIKDSGLTLFTAKQYVTEMCPSAIVKIAVLVCKPDAHNPKLPPCDPDVVGFYYTGEDFLIGCGLGYGEKFRGVRQLLTVKDGEEI